MSENMGTVAKEIGDKMARLEAENAELAKTLEEWREQSAKYQELYGEMKKRCEELEADNIRLKGLCKESGVVPELVNDHFRVKELIALVEKLKEALEQYMGKFGDCGDTFDQAKEILESYRAFKEGK